MHAKLVHIPHAVAGPGVLTRPGGAPVELFSAPWPKNIARGHSLIPFFSYFQEISQQFVPVPTFADKWPQLHSGPDLIEGLNHKLVRKPVNQLATNANLKLFVDICMKMQTTICWRTLSNGSM